LYYKRNTPRSLFFDTLRFRLSIVTRSLPEVTRAQP